ncbi:class I SAM-dependent methyltransferase [Brumimicrobium mesophilum]|uniref:class I SAM-dependent methyltransferase n=1 Tax=Brumimicrobium mesophilum TaxID=392717 RepID=UPI000D140193|nr:class I SAM-dependent methyltransferase [Brumimicrobium mesophilum]
MIKSIYRFLSPKFQTLFSDYKVDMKPRYGHGKPPHKELYSIINENRNLYKDFLSEALRYKDNIQNIKKTGEDSDVNNPTWNNGFLPGLDIVGIYSMMAINNPKKYIEVGSGNSTKVAFKAKKENDLDTEIISIDPMPRAEIDHLADTVIRKPFEEIDYNTILALEENDILFIDNSHRILPNSDSMVFYMEILPKLKKGVIVHIHDIYLPYDYPQFMCDRFYTEQYGLAMFMLANPEKYNTILPNYFISEDKELSEMIKPFWDHANLKGVETHGGSFWLKIM